MCWATVGGSLSGVAESRSPNEVIRNVPPILSVALVSPLVMRMASNILFNAGNTRIEGRESASLAAPSKFLGMILIGQPASCAHCLGQGCGAL